MNEIATEVKSTDLLERAVSLNRLSEVSQVALGMVLAQIKLTEAYRASYETFDQYYKSELRRSKGDVSRLLKVGNFMLDNGFPEETAPPYTVLYHSILSLPDKSPDYILATAKTNTISEIMENRRDEKFGSDHQHLFSPENYKRCDECNKFERT